MKTAAKLEVENVNGPIAAREEPQSVVTALSTGDKLLDYLVAAGRLDRSAAARVTAAMSRSGQAADIVLLELGLLNEQDLAAVEARLLGLSVIRSADFPLEPVPAGAVPAEFWKNSQLIPIAFDDAKVIVATWRPLEREQVDALAFYLSRQVDAVVAVKSEFERAFAQLHAPKAADDKQWNGATIHDGGEDDVERLRDFAREEPVIRLVNRLIAEAASRAASDIHIEALEDHVRVRYRIDGVLQTVEKLDKALQAGVISRIKILARLNIAERRLPQDGRFKLPVRGSEIDFRISTVPSLHGESVVLRILDRREVALDFPSLGFTRGAVERIEGLLANPNGIILVTGPTGSGKTTTLYAAMTLLNSQERKILTIEDPIEYQLPGINQTQVKPQIGLDFASALRSFLRQDPDIIMVGEIRDAETAKTAVQASLTGHLVLSTVHTNSATSTVTRLIDMGVDDYLLVATLRGIIAQRLVRRLCPQCAKTVPASANLLARFEVPQHIQTIFAERGVKHAVGCKACNGVGYRGRTTISEILAITPSVQEVILGGASVRDIEATAQKEGMQSLFANGMALVASGETSLDEVLRAAGTQ